MMSEYSSLDNFTIIEGKDAPQPSEMNSKVLLGSEDTSMGDE